jgi:formate-dependent phosphoribosylglycinamide formyltransferase (GAR transformylase)
MRHPVISLIGMGLLVLNTTTLSQASKPEAQKNSCSEFKSIVIAPSVKTEFKISLVVPKDHSDDKMSSNPCENLKSPPRRGPGAWVDALKIVEAR